MDRHGYWEQPNGCFIKAVSILHWPCEEQQGRRAIHTSGRCPKRTYRYIIGKAYSSLLLCAKGVHTAIFDAAAASTITKCIAVTNWVSELPYESDATPSTRRSSRHVSAAAPPHVCTDDKRRDSIAKRHADTESVNRSILQLCCCLSLGFSRPRV
jgi:hypothetical protein